MTPIVSLEVRGAGPAVLFLHGMPTPWDVLRPVADACAGCTTLLAALPGYGSSPPWKDAVSVDDMAGLIERTLLAAGHRAVKIVGFSGGAHLALRVATRSVVRVDALVALGGVGDFTDEERAGTRQLAALVRRGPLPSGVAGGRFLSRAFAAAHPEAAARVEAWGAATSGANLARELEAIAGGSPVLPSLAFFRGALLARTGSLDAATPVAHARAIAGACPQGVLQIVEGAGHALLEEDLAGTVRAVTTALNR